MKEDTFQLTVTIPEVGDWDYPKWQRRYEDLSIMFRQLAHLIDCANEDFDEAPCDFTQCEMRREEANEQLQADIRHFMHLYLNRYSIKLEFLEESSQNLLT